MNDTYCCVVTAVLQTSTSVRVGPVGVRTIVSIWKEDSIVCVRPNSSSAQINSHVKVNGCSDSGDVVMVVM